MNRTPVRGMAAAAMMMVVLLVGCAPATMVPPGAAFPVGARMTNAEIVGVVMTVNNGEIETGRAVLNRATSPAVRDFAQRMITDHTAVNDRLRALGVAPMDNSTSMQIQTTTRQTVERLNQYQGAELDRAYMDNQIAIHQYALQTLDDVLIPSAATTQLRTELQNARTIFASHLAQAQQIRPGL